MDISKLCSKDTPKLCVYCKHSSSQIDEQSVLCKHYGSVLKSHSCKKFIYNPLKRTPPKRVSLGKNFNFEDMDL